MAEAAPSRRTYKSGAAHRGPPDLRFLHYNDVYHIDAGSRDPVGGAARFVTLTNHYRAAPGPKLLTFFSGDAFNPSLESSVTKGRHMVPILNEIGTDAACLGNHDLDFGVDQTKYLTGKCKFPWLCSNVEDPALGEGVSIAGLQKSVVIENNGIKVGVIGVVEREWLDTINSLPPNLKYTSASVMATREAKRLRSEGCEIIVVVSHQREPNDIKLATKVGGELVDIVLGGHDHHYAHDIVNGVHVIRSGCDFKQLSYIEVRRKVEGKGWDFDIIRRDVTHDVPEDPHTKSLVSSLTSHLNAKLAKPVGFTACPLDARFSVIRCQESNIANFVCDLMRFYYSADCTIMAGGTIRGDQIYPAGVVKLKDIVTCFPFEDPVVVCRLTGAAIVEALENGVSKLPALEGRFPHVSGMKFSFDVSRPVGDRIVSCVVAGVPVDKSTYDKKFSVATRGYMMKGKDGFTSLIGAEEVVDEESGVLISTILRQYFLSLKILGKWTRGDPLRKLFGVLRKEMEDHGELVIPEKVRKIEEQHELGVHEEEEWQVDSPSDSEDSSDDLDEDETTIASAIARGIRDAQDPEKKKLTKEEKEIARRMGAKWARIAGVKTNLQQVEWTVCINPKIEGRITDVTPKGLGEAAEKMGEAVEQVVAEAN